MYILQKRVFRTKFTTFCSPGELNLELHLLDLKLMGENKD